MIEELSLRLEWTGESSATEVDVAALVPAYAALLFRVAHAVLRNHAEAEDVVQDTFLRVLQHRVALPGIRELRPWLVRIAWNLALDRRRRMQPGQLDAVFAATLVAPGTPADRALAESRQAAAVLAAIDRLPRAERQVLLLSGVEELDPGEVAAVLGKSPSATRALLFRARTRLRQRLAQKGVL